MNVLRNLTVSFFVFCVMTFFFVASLQAASVFERQDLNGPETAPRTCDGAKVGRVTIDKKGQSLANKIVGGIFNKDKSDDSIRVTVRVYREGVTPNTTFNVMWAQPAMAGECYQMGAANRTKIGELTTDAEGNGDARVRVDGNPFPGSDGAVIMLCLPGVDAELCLPFADGDERYTSQFSTMFP